MIRLATIAAITLALAATTACAHNTPKDVGQAPPAGDYQPVSDLVPLPEFIPGMGKLYVQPDTLPAGPFLAYDRTGKLASTVYMIPLAGMDEHMDFSGLAAPGGEVTSVDIVYNPGHPGVAEPHYHIVLHHLPAGEAKLQ